jgi:catechol 2,3-dioxygenase-like lactoylglutathione lyase family enzyme
VRLGGWTSRAQPQSASDSTPGALLRAVDAVTFTVPTLEAGLSFYRDLLGHEVLWRNDAVDQVGLRCPDSGTEIVLSTTLPAEPNWLVNSADGAAAEITHAGGRLVSEIRDIPVGRVAIVEDLFGNRLVLVDLSKGRYGSGVQVGSRVS